MKRLIAVGAALALAVTGTAAAITNGAPDGTNHPNVGAFLVQRPSGWRVLCTGTLVAPRVFLTASHCTSYAEANGWTVGVTFQSTDAENPATVLAGHTVTNPLYRHGVSHDVSIILLDKAVTGIPFAKLPQVGLLDEMKKTGAIDTTYTNVGYGTHEKVKNAGGPADFPFDGDRWYSFSSYSALNQDDIHLHQKDNADEGGTCYGDSGGPTLATAPDGKEYVVAVVSTGDVPCWSTSVNTRTDTQEARDFLAPYLALS
jgi:secreted trypsin-like serine protease